MKTRYKEWVEEDYSRRAEKQHLCVHVHEVTITARCKDCGKLNTKIIEGHNLCEQVKDILCDHLRTLA